MVRLAGPERLPVRAIDPEASVRRTVPKKTAGQSPFPKVSPNATSGLIAKTQAPRRSVGATLALDDHSHRTDSVQLRSLQQDRAVDTSGASASARTIAPPPAATPVRHLATADST